MNFMSVVQARKALGAEADMSIAPNAVTVGIRLEHLSRVSNGAGGLTGVIDVVEEFGEFSQCHVQVDNADPADPLLIFKSDTPGVGGEGDRITLRADPSKLHTSDREGRTCRVAPSSQELLPVD